MSNISVYKTNELDISTNFTNNFLDSLLEQYCESKYTPNTIIKDGFKKISLDDLILMAYPGYYKKAPGLYGSVSSTHVIIVYDEKLENTLQEALSHKLSRLFVRYSPSDIKKLEFVEGHTASWDFGSHRTLSRNFSVDTYEFHDMYLLRSYLDKDFSDIKASDLELNKMKTRVAISSEPFQPVLVYKPDVDFISNVNKTLISRNDDALLLSGFFINSPGTVVSSYWLAIHLRMRSSLSYVIKSSVSNSCYEKLIQRSNEILRQQKPVMMAYLQEIRCKKDHEDYLAKQEKEAKEQLARESARMQYKLDPETVENNPQVNYRVIQPVAPVESTETCKEQTGFGIIFFWIMSIIAAIIILIVF